MKFAYAYKPERPDHVSTVLDGAGVKSLNSSNPFLNAYWKISYLDADERLKVIDDALALKWHLLEYARAQAEKGMLRLTFTESLYEKSFHGFSKKKFIEEGMAAERKVIETSYAGLTSRLNTNLAFGARFFYTAPFFDAKNYIPFARLVDVNGGTDGFLLSGARQAREQFAREGYPMMPAGNVYNASYFHDWDDLSRVAKKIEAGIQPPNPVIDEE